MSQGPPRAYAHLLITAKSITESALTIIGGKIKMGKTELLTSVLVAALIISISVNVYLGSKNLALSNQKNADNTKLEMTSILSQAQVQAEAQLQQIGGSLIYASQQLSTLGIACDQTQAIVSALAENNSFIIDAATQDLNNVMVTVEPSAYNYSVGRNIGEQTWLNPNPYGPITPTMTPIMPLVENLTGVAIGAPVFNTDKIMIGTVSVIFNPQALLNATISALVKDKPYGVTVMQLNGLSLYDTDASQVGKNLFTDPMYASYTELLAFGHRVVDEPSGYGTYTYTLNAASNQVATKECYWTTISAYGQEWRIAINHALNS